MKNVNRRNFLKFSLASVPALATTSLFTIPQSAKAAACDPTKPPASGLQYVKDAAKSDMRNKANRKTEFCHNCIQYAQAKRKAKKSIAKTGTDTCVLFPGCEVEAKGWCMTWVKAQ